MNASGGRVWAEISLDRLKNNYRIVKGSAPTAKIMAAIKADAYGHGAIEVAHTLESEGIHMFGVASVEEGVELRHSGINSRILVLSPVLYDQIDAMLDHDIIPTISELGFFEALDRKLKERGVPWLVHVEVDTGMTRTGFSIEEADRALSAVCSSPRVKIDGIFSHFPMADVNGAFTKKQLSDFDGLVSRLRSAGIGVGSVHIANSSGIFKWPGAHYDLVRPGIALYGLKSSPNVVYHDSFGPVMALKSRVVNIRRVNDRTPISYGHTYSTRRPSTIATVSIGYADGFPRLLSNKGEVLIRSRRVPIVGTVCMDLIMVDVTEVPDVQVGDVATVIGKDGSSEITVEECATLANTIVYEITSGIGPRVARVFMLDGKIVKMRTLLGRWGNGECQ